MAAKFGGELFWGMRPGQGFILLGPPTTGRFTAIPFVQVDRVAGQKCID